MNDETKQITSSEFRIKYQQLTEIHEVTALNRVIGIWTPIAPIPYSIGPSLDQPMRIEFRPAPKPISKKKVKR